MKFSIITVCFNSEKTIEKNLISIKNQSYKNYEHLIIDGKSKDKTLDIIRNFKNDKLKLFSESDNGIFDAMNKGLNLAIGEYIIFLNSDDYFNNDLILEKINHNLNGECIIYGNILIKKQDKIYRKWVSKTYHSKKLKYGWMPPHPGTFIKKEFILQNKLKFQTRYKISADYDFLIKALKASNKVTHINIYISDMMHGGNSTKNLISIVMKKIEDYKIIKSNNIGGIGTLLLKSLGKVNQLFV